MPVLSQRQLPSAAHNCLKAAAGRSCCLLSSRLADSPEIQQTCKHKIFSVPISSGSMSQMHYIEMEKIRVKNIGCPL